MLNVFVSDMTASKNSGHHFFSGKMKMADLLDGNPVLLGVFLRLDIGFGFGEDTVEEVCRKRNLNPETFLLICNVYSFDGYMPSAEFLRKVNLNDIVRYLRMSHAYYTDEVMLELESLIEKMIAPCDDSLKRIIRCFFMAYKDELAKHFYYEESVVFPYVSALLSHKEDKSYTIGQFEENHTNVDEKLGDLKNIVMKYMPAQCESIAVSKVLEKLFTLQFDLEKHTSIEDNILVPAVGRLEYHE